VDAMKEKEARERLLRTIMRHYSDPSGKTLEDGMAQIRDSWRTGALNRTEREALKRALAGADEVEHLAARYGT
jgi:hypothetical protein